MTFDMHVRDCALVLYFINLGLKPDYPAVVLMRNATSKGAHGISGKLSG